MTVNAAVTNWMLDSDPALRWQVQRDIVGAPAEVWNTTRMRVSEEGMGARLLALQDADGQWAGGSYFPADFDWAEPDPRDGGGQPYTATTWSLNTLRDWGVDASALAGTAEKLAANSRWDYNGAPYWQGEVDCCINGYTLANGTWLGADVSALPQWFVDHRLDDGGWNCEWESGSTRSSFDSTLNSLRGILYWEIASGGTDQVRHARHGAEEYLLERRLMFRLSTGERVADRTTDLGYPFRWFYTALNALDYFREAAFHDGVPPDPRLAEAIEAVRSAQQPDGTWLQEQRYPGRSWFEMDVEVGEPSKWLTFFATRVLDWWDTAAR